MHNPYQPPTVDPGRELDGVEHDPEVHYRRAVRSAVLGGIAVSIVSLPPIAIVLGLIAWSQARKFMDAWYRDPSIRGKGAAIAGRIMGIASIPVSLFMVLYFVFLFGMVFNR